MFISCNNSVDGKEEDKIFHAGPVNSGVGVIFFALYKENKYQFCDGNAFFPGGYTGSYKLFGDTLILYGLKNSHQGIPTNKFIIRRYADMDSTYWQWKYTHSRLKWQDLKYSDESKSSTGDVFPLDAQGRIVFDINNYWLIRLDSLKNNP